MTACTADFKLLVFFDTATRGANVGNVTILHLLALNKGERYILWGLYIVFQDVSRGHISDADSQILTVISYLGCGISSIFLGITLLTYLAFE